MIAREASPAVSRLGLSVIGVIGVMVRPRQGLSVVMPHADARMMLMKAEEGWGRVRERRPLSAACDRAHTFEKF